MRIILLERIPKLGFIGDQVDVKDGFARNYLLPKKKALRATEKNIEYFKNKKADIEANNLKLKSDAEKLAEKMGDLSIMLVRQASESGMLFGSVRALDIAEAVTEEGFKIEKRQVEIPTPIKTVGNHLAKIVLHPEVVKDISIRVLTAQELGGGTMSEDAEEEIEGIVVEAE